MKMLAGRYVVIGLVIVAVIAAVVAGLVFLGSRTEERLRQMDQKRVDDLRNIASAIDPRMPARVPDEYCRSVRASCCRRHTCSQAGSIPIPISASALRTDSMLPAP